MASPLARLGLLFKDPALRKRLLVVVAGLVLFRLGANIPIPGVDIARLNAFLSNNAFFGLLNIFSGGGLSQLSIFMLGVGPYITASIIMQLMTMIFPRMKELYQEEGEAGRKRFAQYSRLASVPLSILQAFALLTLLARQGILGALEPFQMVTNVIVVTAGAALLMWIAEQMTEYGIGNGMSILIFAGIVARFPTDIAQALFTFDAAQLPVFVVFAVIALFALFAVVTITEAERPIPVTYAKQVRGSRMFGGSSTYIPLRLNQTGVMPIIFAISILLFPQMIGNFLAASSNATVLKISAFLVSLTSDQLFYGIAYFTLVFLFTYFYTAITFDPDQISENLQKSGAFISGVRPGRPTSEYLGRVLSRITFVGALFLGIIAILPVVLQSTTGVQSLTIGGTSLLIVVSVVLELLKQLEAQLSMREY